ncbi:hypothetical protein NC653_019184 [Populus alba x Populus x berolinensis]|uniref:Transmembrane protein n=1 Tax=Populus alba x Populus x berolinensis TaxID=444605 RepID=A0AAD6VWV8_9ROSI|nr:hypothetical protein NC653_019184 [Populus alba x Populus x berolinensis]
MDSSRKLMSLQFFATSILLSLCSLHLVVSVIFLAREDSKM